MLRPVSAPLPVSSSAVCAALLAGALVAQDPASPPPAPSEPAKKQQDPRPQDPPQQEVVVTATRSEQDPFTVPRSVDVMTAQDMQRMLPRTLPQALRQMPGVMVQETAPGQGSPYLRGFTGYGNVLLIDGIRLNNSAFRSGPNQYWNTVDPLSLERIEVLRGTASTLYGSDAVGGTVQVFTKSAKTFGTDGYAVGGSLYSRYGTAENSLMGRGEFEVGRQWADGSRTGFLLGADAKAFGDVEGGSDTDVQLETGYDETNFDFKVEHWLDAETRLVFLHQRISQDAVPRTHATIYGESFRGTAVGTDRQRDTFQDRSLTYLQYHRTGMGGPLGGMHLSVSWHEQSQEEDRITGSGSQTWQGFTVGTLGLLAQFESDLGDLGQLTWGVDYYRDNVRSHFRRASNPQPPDPIQGPVANDATYDLFGAFVQDRIALGSRAELQLGARYTWAKADANSVRDPSGNKIAIEDDWSEISSSAHLRFDLAPEHWNVYGGVSQGFRAPSLSDLSSFDVARSGEQEVPSPGLDAEHYLGYEIGTKVRTGDVDTTLAWFYTDIEDQIQRYPTGAVNGSGQPIVTKANVGEGYIQGVEFQYAWEVLERTTLFGSNTWQYGRVSNYNTGGTTIEDEYPSRLMPFTTQVGLRWEDVEGRFYAETLVVRAEDADKLSSGDQRDTQRIPPGGTPSYTVWHLRAGWQVDDRTRLDFGVDNITDVDYRVHGSGSNSPGTNFVVGMTMTF